MISTAVQAFECVRAWFTFLQFVAPSELSVILGFVRTVTLDIFGALYSARESGMSLFPAVLALGTPGFMFAP